jgi:preprotein translocase subunit SecD
MTRTTTELRAALQLLAEQAPSVEDLDHRAWSDAADPATRSRHHRPRGRTVFAALASAAVVIALVVAVVEIIGARTGSGPAAGGAALEVRPLVAPAVPVTPSGARSPDPLHALTFPVPRSETGYDRLSAAQQQQLLAALATTDCSTQTASTAPTRIACADGPGHRQPTAYLLGPSIFGRDQLADAQPIAPSAPSGSGEWSVLLTLGKRASTAWARYTTAHHALSAGKVDATQCASSGTPCADFVAFVVNGSAVTVPGTLAPITGGRTLISSNLDRQTATTLAEQLRP